MISTFAAFTSSFITCISSSFNEERYIGLRGAPSEDVLVCLHVADPPGVVGSLLFHVGVCGTVEVRNGDEGVWVGGGVRPPIRSFILALNFCDVAG